MKAGQMDRKITVVQPTETKNSYQEAELAWSTFAEPWADWQEGSGRAFFSAARVNSEISVVAQIRWTPDIIPAMRVVEDGRIFEIVSIAQIGRRVGQSLSLKGPISGD